MLDILSLTHFIYFNKMKNTAGKKNAPNAELELKGTEMDFIDNIRALANKIEKLRKPPATEEATKTALVMPFISLLGYDIFNPNEVIPEFTADIGHKKGEKVDYAITRDDEPVILIECKTYGTELAIEHISQLLRYFSTQSSVRFGILTNGVQYRFFSDLDETNKMDEKPFFEFDLRSFNEAQIEELKRFTKTAFNLEDIISAAGELKYTREIKRIMADQLSNPSEDFIRFFASRIYPGRLMQSVLDRFHGILKYALQQFINEKVNDRLKSALDRTDEDEQHEREEEKPAEPEVSTGIITTEEEMEAFYIIKAILRELVESDRVVMRDKKNFCYILLDNTNRQPICRLYFNKTEKKYMTLYNENKDTQEVPVNSLDDIFKYADNFKRCVSSYITVIQE